MTLSERLLVSAVDLGFVVSLLGRRSSNYPALTSSLCLWGPRQNFLIQTHLLRSALRKHHCVLLVTAQEEETAALQNAVSDPRLHKSRPAHRQCVLKSSFCHVLGLRVRFFSVWPVTCESVPHRRHHMTSEEQKLHFCSKVWNSSDVLEFLKPLLFTKNIVKCYNKLFLV